MVFLICDILRKLDPNKNQGEEILETRKASLEELLNTIITSENLVNVDILRSDKSLIGEVAAPIPNENVRKTKRTINDDQESSQFSNNKDEASDQTRTKLTLTPRQLVGRSDSAAHLPRLITRDR